MNIDRANSGMPLTPAVRPAGRFDLTVSDSGVTRATVQPPRRGTEPEIEVQVTSEPALQKVLSAEETQALQEHFPARASTISGVGRVADAGVYGMRGARAPARAATALGQMVDFSG